MNKRKINTGFVFRVAVLTLAIALIFGSMAVFHASEETGEGGTTGTTQSTEAGTDTTSSEADTDPTSASQDTTSSSSEADTDPTSASQDTTSSSSEAGTDTTSASQDTTSSSSEAGTDTTSASQDTTSSSSEAGTDTTQPSQPEAPACPFCGGELDELSGECLEWACHTHNSEYGCEYCEDCGGCLDAMYGLGCHDADGELCVMCSCFDIDTRTYSPTTVITKEEADEIVASETEIKIDLGRDILFFTADDVMTLNQAMNSEGAKITALKAVADPISAAYPNNRELTTYKEIVGGVTNYTPFVNVDYICLVGGTSGKSVPIRIDMTVTCDGISRSISFTYYVKIDDNSDYIKSVTANGSENIELELGKSIEIGYDIVFADGYDGGYQFTDVEISNPDVVDIEIIPEEDSFAVSLRALSKGTSTVKIYIGEGDWETDPVDEVVCTINVTCVGVKAPAGTVKFSETAIEVGEKVTLTAKGWFDGADLKSSTVCYLPFQWSVNPSGTWALPSTLSDETLANAIQRSAQISGLAEKDHTATVTFQRFERDANGNWIKTDATAVGTAKLTVTDSEKPSGGTDSDKDNNKENDKNNSNSGSNNGSGKVEGSGSPDTSDITMRDNSDLRAAGSVMLAAGLCILLALAGERVWRELEARKRQAKAIRR